MCCNHDEVILNKEFMQMLQLEEEGVGRVWWAIGDVNFPRFD